MLAFSRFYPFPFSFFPSLCVEIHVIQSPNGCLNFWLMAQMIYCPRKNSYTIYIIIQTKVEEYLESRGIQMLNSVAHFYGYTVVTILPRINGKNRRRPWTCRPSIMARLFWREAGVSYKKAKQPRRHCGQQKQVGPRDGRAFCDDQFCQSRKRNTRFAAQ